MPAKIKTDERKDAGQRNWAAIIGTYKKMKPDQFKAAIERLAIRHMLATDYYDEDFGDEGYGGYEDESSPGQTHIRLGDRLKVIKPLKGTATVEKRIPKGTILKVTGINKGHNRNEMWVTSPKGSFELNEDRDMGKVQKVGSDSREAAFSGQTHIRLGDHLKVIKPLKGKVTVEKRIPKGTILKVTGINKGHNRNEMWVTSPKGSFELNEDRDMGKVQKVASRKAAFNIDRALERMAERRPDLFRRKQARNQKVIEAPHHYHPVKLQPPKAKRKEYPFEGYIDFQGIKIDVENAKGSTRTGTGPEGDWSTYMNCHYGEIRGTEGTDGDKLDVYVGDNHDSSVVVVIHQHNPWDGKYDEDKVMVGYDSVHEAIGAYLKQYDRPGFYRDGEHTAMPIGQFWRWVNDRKNKGKRVTASASKARWKKGYVEGKPGAINAAKAVLWRTLSMLRALSWNHWTAHWQVQGESSYGDHLLFERLYDATVKEIDTLAEKLVAMFGPSAVDPVEQSKLMGHVLNVWADEPDAIKRSLKAEMEFQQALKMVVDALEDMGVLSLGLDDFLRTMANDHETAVYLLQQRDQGTRVARLLSAKEFGSEKALKQYLKEHPKADPKMHSVTEDAKPKGEEDEGGEAGDPKQLESPEGRKKVFSRVLKKLTDTAAWAKDKIVGVVKEEIQMWKDSGTALKKLISGDKKWADLDTDERKHLVTKAVHTVVMAGLKVAIYAVVPPIAGYGVKQAISSVAEAIVLKKLGAKVAAEGMDMDGFVQTVMSGVEDAVKQLGTGQIDDAVMSSAMDAMKKGKAARTAAKGALKGLFQSKKAYVDFMGQATLRYAAQVGTDTASIYALDPAMLSRLIEGGRWAEEWEASPGSRTTDQLIRQHGGAVFHTGADGSFDVKIPTKEGELPITEMGYMPPYSTPGFDEAIKKVARRAVMAGFKNTPGDY